MLSEKNGEFPKKVLKLLTKRKEYAIMLSNIFFEEGETSFNMDGDSCGNSTNMLPHNYIMFERRAYPTKG